LKAFSFIHAADLHLGYSQYGLETRREDSDRNFEELVERTMDMRPDFLVIAGDIFHHFRPSNATLENTIRNFGRLRDASIRFSRLHAR
jgi:DNA repair exonuclease SbcCD nuclease subunit